MSKETAITQAPVENQTIPVNFDFLKQLEVDYGIKETANQQFEITYEGITYSGTLDYVFNIISSHEKPGASE